jgi:hypothetical protein
VASPLPQIDLNDPAAVADFVLAHAARPPTKSP